MYCTNRDNTILLYGMEAKHFQSRLFKRTIRKDSPFFWQYLYAELLFRIKEITEMQCPCKKCYMDKHDFEWRLSEIENEGKIPKLFRPEEPGTVGYCGRAELPARYKIKKEIPYPPPTG